MSKKYNQEIKNQDNQEIKNQDNLQIINELNLLIKNIEYKLNKEEFDKSEIIKNRFRLKHFKNALKIIKLFPNKIKNGNDLKDISGIGKGIIIRIDEIIETNKLSEIDNPNITNIVKEIDLVNELSQVINIGSKIAKQLIDKYNIKSIEELKKKVKTNKIEINNKIKMGLKYHGVIQTKIPRKEIDKYNKILQTLVDQIDNDLTLIIAGSYRRKKLISNDIDVLITHTKISTNKEYNEININYLHDFISLLKKKKIIVDDLTDTDNGTKYMGFCKLPRQKIRRIDVRFVPYSYYHSNSY